MREINSHLFHEIINGKRAEYITIGTIRFESCRIEAIDLDSIAISKIEKRVEFKNCEFSSTLDIWGVEFVSSLVFTNCTFADDVYFNDVIVGNNFRIDKSQFAKGLNLSGCTIDHGSIYETDLSGVLWINEGTTRKTFLIGAHTSRSNINEITLVSSTSSNLKIKINNCDLNQIGIIGTLSEGEISISNVTANIFHIVDFENQSKFKVYNLKSIQQKDSIFIIDRCNLGKSEFYSIDLTTFEKTSIKDSYVMESIFISIKWDFPIHSASLEELKKKEIGKKKLFENREFTQQLESYRQLRHAMNKSGNYVSEKKFYSYEMNLYNKTLPWNWKNFWTKVILNFSNHCSKYGQSIFRPLAYLLVSNFIFFSILILVFNYQGFHVDFNGPFNLDEANRALGEYLKMLNPARKFDDDLQGIAVLFDLVDRILVSAFLYNIIRATRRFVG